MAKEKFNVKEAITKEIIESLEANKTIWHKDWKCMGVPSSANSGKAYRGINFLILSLKQMAKGYKSSKWVTYKNCLKLGGEVTKGEKSTMVTFYSPYEIIDKETGDKKKIPLLKYYSVFNIEQTSLKDDDRFIDVMNDLDSNMRNEELELVLDNYDCKIEHAIQDKACYYPTLDKILMPMVEQFDSYHAYYSTRIHEMAHSTGHKDRLNRFEDIEKLNSKKENYAIEELVAEITSMFMLATYNIDNEAIKDNNKAYIAGWLKALKSDPDYIFKASRYAQKAFDFITNKTFDNAEAEEKELATV